MKFDAARIHFLSDVFVAVAFVLLLKLPNVRSLREHPFLLALRRSPSDEERGETGVFARCNVRRARLTFEIIRQYVDWARKKCPLFA